jgi:hypothetical protein
MDMSIGADNAGHFTSDRARTTADFSDDHAWAQGQQIVRQTASGHRLRHALHAIEELKKLVGLAARIDPVKPIHAAVAALVVAHRVSHQAR